MKSQLSAARSQLPGKSGSSSVRAVRISKREAGFTLIEMTVAVGLFAVVMVISITALLSVVEANRKAQALQSVINNLNIAVDGMTRSLREGSNYRCGSASPANPNCSDGGSSIYFESSDGSSASSGDDWVYAFDPETNRIYKSENANPQQGIAITAPEVTIDSAVFYVIGATRGDTTQPKVMMVIKGTAGSDKTTSRTTFHIQSTAVQRVLDI